MTREFAIYFTARQCTMVAFAIEDVAINWRIFEIRHLPLDLGLVGLILFIPQLVLALPAGVLADHVDRKTVCVASSLFEALGLLGFVALVAFGQHDIVWYFCAVAFVGIAHTMGIPAQRSLLVNIVPREEFTRAQALTSSVTQLITIAGPALGGVLIAVLPGFAFVVAAAAYIVATMAFAMLQARPAAARLGEPAVAATMKGVRFIFSSRMILGAISLDLFAVLFGGATALMPVYATILHVGPTGYGMLRAAPAVGAAVVAFYLSRHAIARRAGRLLITSVAAFGVATIVFGLSRNFFISAVALAIAGGFDMVSVVIRSGLVQLRTPDVMRGRVGAVENIFIGASNELGAFESGGLAALVGAQGSVVFGGVATLVVIALWSLLFPQLRELDELSTPA